MPCTSLIDATSTARIIPGSSTIVTTATIMSSGSGSSNSWWDPHPYPLATMTNHVTLPVLTAWVSQAGAPGATVPGLTNLRAHRTHTRTHPHALHPLPVHAESEVRASVAFQVSKLASLLSKGLRQLARQEAWDALVTGAWGRPWLGAYHMGPWLGLGMRQALAGSLPWGA